MWHGDAKARLWLAALTVACAVALPAGADAQEDLDDILDGFDSPKRDEAEPEPAESEQASESGLFAFAREWEIDGGLTLGSSMAFAQSDPEPGKADYRGVTRFRSELDLAVEIPLPGSARLRGSGHAFRDFAYALKDRSEFTHEVLQEYEAEIELDELWLSVSPLPNLDLKIGRQVAAFGPADMLRVVDVLNPVDNREPGLIDLEDLRLPVTMTRVESFVGSVRATAIAVHESRLDKQPVFGSDFYPPGVPVLPEDRPGTGGRDTQYSFALARSFGRNDAALYHTRYFERQARPARSGVLEHARLTLTGMSATRTFGSWLIKGELAQIRGLEFVRADDKRSRTDGLVGIEYSGFNEAQIGLEFAMRRLHRFDRELEMAPDLLEQESYEWALRYRRNFLDSTCRFSVMALAFGSRGENGAGARAMLSYKATDAFELELGVLAFRRGERAPFTFIDNNDRIFWKMQYRF